MTPTIDQLEAAAADGRVSVQRHDSAPLRIYNYTPKVQYDRLWCDVTKSSRGLILDNDGQIVARPFRKFFNLGEHQPDEIPSEPFDVFDKADGSLGILYWHDGEPRIATRGSFVSDQSKVATAMLHEQYRDAIDQLQPSLTYLFEIIYPENRIVVDYGDRRELVLLGAVDTATGEELSTVPDIGFPVIRRFDGIGDFRELVDHNEPNREGYVVRFRNGMRIKVKMAEYVRLHRLLTMVSTKTIWEMLRAGESLQDVLDRVPDEFYEWVKRVERDLREQFAKVEREALAEYRGGFESRREAAEYFKTCQHTHLLFRLLDGKPYADAIWKRLKPEYERPYLLNADTE